MSAGARPEDADSVTRVSRMTSAPAAPEGVAALPDGSTFGNYRVITRLGSGGMGEVYEVEHTVLLQRYALKLLHPELAVGQEGRDRFAREARVMASLRHPGIVRVDDFGQTEGRVWLRMELAEGIPPEAGEKRLRTLGELASSRGGRLEAAEVRDVLEQILTALSVAHATGLVHRDLKPANILLAADGRMKVADFGLVQLAGEDWLRSRVNETVARSMTLGSAPTRVGTRGSGSLPTAERALMGTWDYMSPEQKSGGVVDARSDLYAVGLIAFRLLTGETVLAMEMPSEIVSGLDPAWDGWVRKAVASRPEKRFASAADMAAQLPRPHRGATGGPGRATSAAAEAPGGGGEEQTRPPPLPQASSSPARTGTTVTPGLAPAAVAPASADAATVRLTRSVATAEPQSAPAAPGVGAKMEAAVRATTDRGPPSAPAASDPAGGVAAGFGRVSLGLTAACVGSLLSPGLGLLLRGRPALGMGVGALPPLVALLVAASETYLAPSLWLALSLAASLVAIGILLSDGRAGVFSGLDARAAMMTARRLRGWYTVALILTALTTGGSLLTDIAAMIEIDNSSYVSDELAGSVVFLSVVVLLGIWLLVRLARIRRFLGSAGAARS